MMAIPWWIVQGLAINVIVVIVLAVQNHRARRALRKIRDYKRALVPGGNMYETWVD